MKAPDRSEIRFFATPAAFRRWLTANHKKADVLWVGYYKKATGTPSITWPESVDEALCVGWIDGLRRSLDDESYCIRFTPRRPGSNWSDVNIRRVKELKKLGRMKAPGLKAFETRPSKKPYSYERDKVKLSKAYEDEIKSNATAWKFFQALAPSFKKASIHWVMSAKKEETRRRRLGVLIENSAKGRKLPQFDISRKR